MTMISRTCAAAMLAAALALIDASPAHATCDPGLVSQAVIARIQKDSIEQVLKPLGALVPQQTELGQFDVPIGECGLWFDDTIIHFQRGTVHLSNATYGVTLTNGGMDVEIRGDIAATGHLDLEICALPNDSCDAAVVAQGFSAHARVSVGVTDCVPTVSVDAFTVNVSHDNVAIELTGCSAYATAFDVAQEWLRDDLIDYAAAEVQSFVPALVEDQVGALTADLIQPTTVEGIEILAQPEAVDIDANGITMTFGVKSQAAAIADCVAGIDYRRQPSALIPTIDMPQTTSIAVSTRLAQNVIDSAWRAGWLCLDLSSTASPAIDSALSTIIAGTQTRVTMNALAPPRLTFVASDNGRATVELGQLSGRIAVQVPNDRAYTADFLAGLSLDADATMRAATREMVLQPRATTVTPLSITLGTSPLGFSQEGIDRFVRNGVMPYVTRQIGELPLVTGLFDAAYVAVTIGKVRTTNSAVIAEIAMVDIDASDVTPPATVLGDVPVCPCPPAVAITVASTDDTTSGELIRHSVKVDDVATDTALRAGSTVMVTGLAHGHHVIHLAAVDLMGNGDPTGADVSVDIDALPPTLRFVGAPRGIVASSGTRLRLDAEDDTAVANTIDYQVGIVGMEAVADTVIQTGTLRRGEDLVLDGLPDGTTIRVRATAYDTAGNSVEATTSMAVLDQPSMGCQATPTSSVVLLALTFLLRGRRRYG